MASYKKDGTFDTRLMLSGATLTVNFLVYTRWHELWPKAASWIQTVLDAVGGAVAPGPVQPIGVTSLAHQIIDVFLWQDGPDDLSAREIFLDRHPRLPEAAWNATGQSWQSVHSINLRNEIDLLPSAALIDYLLIDVSEEASVGWRLRMEQILEVRLAQPIPPEVVFQRASHDAPKLADSVMEGLHNRNRKLVQSLLRPDMLSRIGMDTN